MYAMLIGPIELLIIAFILFFVFAIPLAALGFIVTMLVKKKKAQIDRPEN